ncbi:MAG: dimethylarginine dimethylaminohydrolase family protein, partial [Acidimicrobiia bacterium]
MWGTGDMVSPLHDVLVRTPTTVGRFVEDGGWREPDRAALLDEHRRFVELLRGLGSTVHVANAIDGLVDAVYMHDPVIMTPHGAILLRMAKPIRTPEPAHARRDLERLGVPILGELTAPAHADGGDKVWLDSRTLLVGHGYRTNAAAIDQIRALLSPHGVTVHAFDLPHFRGPAEVLHLMSVLSPIAHDLAVVYEPLAPVRLLECLRERGIAWIPVTNTEVLTQGANILAVALDGEVGAVEEVDLDAGGAEARLDVGIAGGEDDDAGREGEQVCALSEHLPVAEGDPRDAALSEALEDAHGVERLVDDRP